MSNSKTGKKLYVHRSTELPEHLSRLGFVFCFPK